MCVCGGGGGGGKSCASRFFSTKTLKGGLICSELGRKNKQKNTHRKGNRPSKVKNSVAIVLPRLLLSLESVTGFSFKFRKNFLVYM